MRGRVGVHVRLTHASVRRMGNTDGERERERQSHFL